MFSDTTCLTYQVPSPPSIPFHTQVSIKGFVEGWGLSRRGSWKPQHCKIGLRSKMRKVGTAWMEAMGSCRAVRQERSPSLEGTVRLIVDGSV